MYEINKITDDAIEEMAETLISIALHKEKVDIEARSISHFMYASLALEDARILYQAASILRENKSTNPYKRMLGVEGVLKHGLDSND